MAAISFLRWIFSLFGYGDYRDHRKAKSRKTKYQVKGKKKKRKRK